MKERIVIGRENLDRKTTQTVSVEVSPEKVPTVVEPARPENKIPMMPVGNNVLVELCESKSIIHISNQCQYGWIRAIGYPIHENTIYHPKGRESDLDTNSRRIQVGDKVYMHHGDKSGIKLPENDKFMLVPIENITAIVVE